jgi:hypothetical protein
MPRHELCKCRPPSTAYAIVGASGRTASPVLSLLAERTGGTFDKPVAVKRLGRGMATQAIVRRLLIERCEVCHAEQRMPFLQEAHVEVDEPGALDAARRLVELAPGALPAR